MLVGLCPPPPVGDPWKLAPEPEPVDVVVGVFVVFLVVVVLCGRLIVVLRCIVVPVPILAAVPPVVVAAAVVALALFCLSVMLSVLPNLRVIPCGARIGAHRSWDSTLDCERAEVVHLVALPNNGSTPTFTPLSSHSNPPDLKSIVCAIR